MTYQELMSAVGSLLIHAETAAALAAGARLRSQSEGDAPQLLAALNRVGAAAGMDSVEDLTEEQRRDVVARVTVSLLQAVDLIERPVQQGWDYIDPRVLQAQGQTSAGLPRLIAEPTLARQHARA